MTDESMRRPTADGQRKASGTGFTLEDIVGAYSGAAFQTDGAVKPNTNAAVPKVTAEEIVSAETVPHAEEYYKEANQTKSGGTALYRSRPIGGSEAGISRWGLQYSYEKYVKKIQWKRYRKDT